MPRSFSLSELLHELEESGRLNDATHSERSKRMLNITRDTGEFLAVLIKAASATRILEIGTSNGYSTLWLASACDPERGQITTVEQSAYKSDLAAVNFRRGQLTDRIDARQGDAGSFLRSASSASFDFLFLDSERSEYVGWWPELERVLAPGGLLVVDNATSHPEEMAEFVALVKKNPDFETSLVPVGNGEFLAVKSR
jgi:predicted O-methyltransferase YrrM